MTILEQKWIVSVFRNKHHQDNPLLFAQPGKACAAPWSECILCEGAQGYAVAIRMLLGIEDIMSDAVPSWQEGTGVCFGSVTRDMEYRACRSFTVGPTDDV